MLAFFSYSRIDYEADPELIDELMDQLVKQTRAAHGTRAFDIWRDDGGVRPHEGEPGITWGADWRQRLREVIGGCDLFIVLLSPGWLQSEICLEEYQAFVAREKAFGATDRILTAHIRAYSRALAQRAPVSEVLGDLRRRQQKRWLALWDAEPRERSAEYRKASAEIAAILERGGHAENENALGPAESGSAEAEPDGARSHPPQPIAVPARALASGAHYIVPETQSGPDGARAVMVRLVFPGFVKVTLDEGTIYFRIRAALLCGRPDGAAATRFRTEFDHGWQGPIANVQIVESGERISYLVAAQDGSSLAGNPLADPKIDDDGYTRLFDLKSVDGQPMTCQVFVEVDAEVIEIDSRTAQLDHLSPADRQSLDAMKRRLAEMVISATGASHIALPEDRWPN